MISRNGAMRMGLDGAVLPYRSDAADLQQLIHALLRGQSLAQVRRAHFSPKTFEGVVATAHALALVDHKTGAVTAAGRRYALATPADRAAALQAMLASYPPFAEVLRGSRERGEPSTPLRWIVSWWAAHGYGSSESNRVEAAPAFAKLVEAARLGAYVQGRKGHPSRIEWNGVGFGSLPVTEREDANLRQPVRTAEGCQKAAAAGDTAAVPLDRSAGKGGEVDRNLLEWELGPSRRVKLELPGGLSATERARLRQLVELLLGNE